LIPRRAAGDLARRLAFWATAGAVAFCAVPDAARAADGGPLRCTVVGYDLFLCNDGAATLPAGTTFAWSVPFARAKGTETLTRDLEPGAQALFSAMLGSSYLGSDKPCHVEIFGN